MERNNCGTFIRHVLPKDKAITVFLLQEEGKYDAGATYESKGKVPIHIFDDYLIDLEGIFE